MDDSGSLRLDKVRSPTISPDAVIVYHDLTHETLLPSPVPFHKENVEIIPPPDLRSYDSPFNWSQSRKTFITWLSCTVTVVTAYTAGAYSPPAQQMSEYWHVSTVAIFVGITTFTTGFAIAPMVLAPFSELNGRRPVFIATGILFVLCQLCCAITRSYGGMLAARFFTGVGGSTFSTMVGGVISDIYHHEDRNMPMCLFTGAAMMGTGLGPMVSGFVAQHLEWRWVFYLQAIDGSLVILAVIMFFQETRGSVLLSRKARVLNDWYEAREKAGLIGFSVPSDTTGIMQIQRIRWRVRADEERDSLAKMIAISCYRPFRKCTLIN
ncbi:uncharacterized protein KY384_001889 [Bacidia gigantensis]|uniref:uncharacterized protein n=1 Tax=Bacidia gigantensis TaxID=2732470 RepID=UPI001D039EF6|nr:uncharacterized protein KY384_001889 [Bacidia gigantensis]KAG8533106.1 hypothetical protein KY384_001889 [Bacidia gigantensis]